MNPSATDERLAFLLTLLPSAGKQPHLPHSPDFLEGLLCGSLCANLAEDAVSVLDKYWGEAWAEALMEQELLEELMAWLEERWQSLLEALHPDQLQQDPDALPLADTLAWAGGVGRSDAQRRVAVPEAARQWAHGFLAGSAHASADPAGRELREVIAALTLESGPLLQAYLHDAYEHPHETDAAALIDDALFAAQDLRLASMKTPGR